MLEETRVSQIMPAIITLTDSWVSFNKPFYIDAIKILVTVTLVHPEVTCYETLTLISTQFLLDLNFSLTLNFTFLTLNNFTLNLISPGPKFHPFLNFTLTLILSLTFIIDYNLKFNVGDNILVTDSCSHFITSMTCHQHSSKTSI